MKVMEERSVLKVSHLFLSAAAMLLIGGQASAYSLEDPLNMDFECNFPVFGDRIVTANLYNTLPDEVQVDAQGNSHILGAILLPEAVNAGLDNFVVARVDGQAVIDATLELPLRDLAITPWMKIMSENTASDAPLNLFTHGSIPFMKLNSGDVGTGTIRVNSLFVRLQGHEEDGRAPASPLDDMPIRCDALPYQDNVLSTFQILPK